MALGLGHPAWIGSRGSRRGGPSLRVLYTAPTGGRKDLPIAVRDVDDQHARSKLLTVVVTPIGALDAWIGCRRLVLRGTGRPGAPRPGGQPGRLLDGSPLPRVVRLGLLGGIGPEVPIRVSSSSRAWMRWPRRRG